SQLPITNYQSLFSIPPTIRNNPHFIQQYIKCFINSLFCYQKLTGIGIKPREAIFVIPRGIKISVVQTFNLYNLIAGYYPLRLCSTADEEIQRISIQEAEAIKKELSQKKLSILNKFIVPKCLMFGFCNEENFCNQIKAKVKNYNEDFKFNSFRLGMMVLVEGNGEGRSGGRGLRPPPLRPLKVP
ncbi:TPA: hypothetical protein EYP26_05820, partial [Candidatus Bathyarchaeota archaeon]|nr:hypothetical protein [Candidatus Bathyarchaeota archaeon]